MKQNEIEVCAAVPGESIMTLNPADVQKLWVLLNPQPEGAWWVPANWRGAMDAARKTAMPDMIE